MLALLALLLSLPLSMPDKSLPAEPTDAPEAVIRGCGDCDCCSQLRSGLEQSWSWLQKHESRLTRLENAQRNCCPAPQDNFPPLPPNQGPSVGLNLSMGATVVALVVGVGLGLLFRGRRESGGGCKYASGGLALLMAVGLATSSSADETRLPASGWQSAARPLVPVQRDPFRQLEDRDGSYKLIQPFSVTAKVDEAPKINLPQVQFMDLADVAWKWTNPSPWHACALRLQTADGAVGSGVYMQLAPDLWGVLTAHHVVEGARLQGIGGRWIDASPQRFTQCSIDRGGADLAFLTMSGPRPDVPPLHWTDRKPANGEYLEAMGYGSGANTLRHYAMLYEGDAYQGKDRSDGQAMHGDSGGGILTLDSLGRVAVVSVCTNGEGQGYQSRGGRYYESMLFPAPEVVHRFLCDVVSGGGRRTSAADAIPMLTRVSIAPVATAGPETQCGPCDPYGGGQYSEPPQYQQQPQRQAPQQQSGRQYEERDEPIFPPYSPYQIGPQQPQQGWGQQPQQPQQNWGQQSWNQPPQDRCGPGGCPPQQPGWGQQPQSPSYGQPTAAGSPAMLVLGLLGVGGVVGLMYFLSQD